MDAMASRRLHAMIESVQNIVESQKLRYFFSNKIEQSDIIFFRLYYAIFLYMRKSDFNY